MKENRSGAQKYFEDYAENFNASYQGSSLSFLTPLKQFWWKDLVQREKIALESCLPVTGKSVLDIGCGDGHHAIAFKNAGCSDYLGVDFSNEMISLCQKYKERFEKIDFQCTDFLQHDFGRRYDFTIALGVMDYIREPKKFIEKALQTTNEKIMLSFPQQTLIRGNIRWVKYNMRGCPIWLYTKNKIDRLLSDIPMIQSYKIHSIDGYGMDYVAEISPKT